MTRYHEPKVLMRYDIRRANKYLVERLDGRPERKGKSFAIKINPNIKDVNLWVPNGIEVYSSVIIPGEVIKRLIYTNREEGNDLACVYASLISEQGENPSLFDFNWFNPGTSLRIYNRVNGPSINFDKLNQEFSAPYAIRPGFSHPLKDI